MTAAPRRRTILKGGALLMAGLVGSGCAQPAPDPQLPDVQRHVREHYIAYTDLEYAPPAARGHLLDVYLPRETSGPFPVVIFQMGSAFANDDTKGNALADGDGEKDQDPVTAGGMIDAPQLARHLVPHGYAVVGLNVRSSSQIKFPGQVHDVKAAIRYLRAHAGTFGLDSHRFATMGNSSGGWVATMAAVTAGVTELEGDLGNPDRSSTVGAVVDLYGPTDFLAMDEHRLPDGQLHSTPDSPESQLMGFSIEQDRSAVERADPATYVRADSPPAFIVHGTADPLVPANQSELLFEAYARAGATATLALLPGVGHTDAYLYAADYSPGRAIGQTRDGVTSRATEPAPTFEAIVDFLDTHL
jgi:acetyl esterase/lipase